METIKKLFVVDLKMHLRDLFRLSQKPAESLHSRPQANADVDENLIMAVYKSRSSCKLPEAICLIFHRIVLGIVTYGNNKNM